MTGQIAFARTIRALDADDFRGSKLGLLVALALLACWTCWMFAARIPQYEVTANARLELDHNSAAADFPATTRIHPGQHAQIVWNDGDIIEAQVEKVRNEPTGSIRVQFNLFSIPATSHQPPATARVSVETNRISPAALVLRALK
jgi:hypothetical protein